MKTGEIIRVIIFSLLGAIFMFAVQPLIYKQGLLWEPNVQNPEAALEAWASGEYMAAATCVFAISVFSTILWCVLAAKSKAHRPDEIKQWSLWWWILGLIPILSIGVAIGLLNSILEVRWSLAILFVLDILMLFWLTTATSTPGLVMYTPPLGRQMRDVLRKFGVVE
ncbi:MAG: hypothetical protein HC930_04110 [Hydrococcus sp. SU_1_0]|nr:hypothetical protein [Hydrococcus sp. SU_1_0]